MPGYRLGYALQRTEEGVLVDDADSAAALKHSVGSREASEAAADDDHLAHYYYRQTASHRAPSFAMGER